MSPTADFREVLLACSAGGDVRGGSGRFGVFFYRSSSSSSSSSSSGSAL